MRPKIPIINKKLKIMTVTSASNLLFSHLSEGNDTFSLKSDFLNLVKISTNELKDRAAIQLALIEYEKLGILSSTEIKGEKIYVLVKPISTYDQHIKISSELAGCIEKLINTYCSITKDEKNTCKASQIEEKDIKNLLLICSLLNQNSPKTE